MLVRVSRRHGPALFWLEVFRPPLILGLVTIPVCLSGEWWLLALMLLPCGVFTAPTVAATD